MTDRMTPEQRSYCMSRVKGKDTSLELKVRSELHRRGLRFRKHYTDLPGRPDIAFPRARLAVFLDGDFWHGRNFSSWKGKLSEYWLNKITRNRSRDDKNRRKCRSMGWSVIRIWEREVNEDLGRAIGRIVKAFREAAESRGIPVQAGALADQAQADREMALLPRPRKAPAGRARKPAPKPSGRAGAGRVTKGAAVSATEAAYDVSREGVPGSAGKPAGKGTRKGATGSAGKPAGRGTRKGATGSAGKPAGRDTRKSATGSAGKTAGESSKTGVTDSAERSAGEAPDEGTLGTAGKPAGEVHTEGVPGSAERPAGEGHTEGVPGSAERPMGKDPNDSALDPPLN
jgi:DNA mismatch endonuclease (patch repair protein)